MLGSFHDKSITRMSKDAFSAFDILPETDGAAHRKRFLVKDTFREKPKKKDKYDRPKEAKYKELIKKEAKRDGKDLMFLKYKKNPLAMSSKARIIAN